MLRILKRFITEFFELHGGTMKKFTIIAMMFTVLTSFVYADDDNDTGKLLTRKAVIKDAEKNNYSLLSRDEDTSLYVDKNGIFILYKEYNNSTSSNSVSVYTEVEEVTEAFVRWKAHISTLSSTWLVGQYRVVYLFTGWDSPSYRFVETPKGKYYDVSKLVKGFKIHDGNIIED